MENAIFKMEWIRKGFYEVSGLGSFDSLNAVFGLIDENNIRRMKIIFGCLVEEKQGGNKFKNGGIHLFYFLLFFTHLFSISL